MSRVTNDVPISSVANLPRLTVGTAILDSTTSKVYLMKRPPEVPFGGKLAFPGGTVVATDETLAAAAEREILQRTQLKIQITQFLTWFHFNDWLFAVFVAHPLSTDIDQKLEESVGQWYTWESLDTELVGDALAPNIYEACQETRKWINMFKQKFFLKKIPNALLSAKTVLLENFRQTDPSGGWNHYLYESNPGIIGTAVGLRALLATGQSAFSKEIQMARTFLKTNQNSDGGWSILALRKMETPRSISESTSLALLALLEAGEDSNADCIAKGFSWLRANQCHDGGWNLTSGFERSRVLTTTLVLEAFSLLGEMGEEYKKGIRWLINAQHQNGMWSIYSFRNVHDQVGSPTHVARALIRFDRFEHQHEYSAQIAKGLKWLTEHYEKGKGLQSWAGSTEIEFFKQPEVIGIQWTHFAVPWCIKALIKNGLWLNEEPVADALQHIIENQGAKGIWQPPGLERVVTWALYDCASVLELVSLQSRYHLETAVDLATTNHASKRLDQLVVYLNSLSKKPSLQKPSIRYRFSQKVRRLSTWTGWALFLIALLWSLGVWEKLWHLGSNLPLDNLWVQIFLGLLVTFIAALFLRILKRLREFFQ